MSGKHLLFWKDSEELLDTTGKLLSEREIVPMIKDHLVDTECTNTFCRETGGWWVWDVAVEGERLVYFPLSPDEREVIESFSKSRLNSLESINYRRTCLSCGQQREELDVFYPDRFYFNDQDDLFGRRALNEIIRSLREDNVECEWCDLFGNWAITDIEMCSRELNTTNS